MKFQLSKWQMLSTLMMCVFCSIYVFMKNILFYWTHILYLSFIVLNFAKIPFFFFLIVLNNKLSTRWFPEINPPYNMFSKYQISRHWFSSNQKQICVTSGNRANILVTHGVTSRFYVDPWIFPYSSYLPSRWTIHCGHYSHQGHYPPAAHISYGFF